MTKDELSRTIGIIEKQLIENERVYRKYELKTKEELGSEVWDSVIRLGESSVALMIIKNELTTKLREEYGIFII